MKSAVRSSSVLPAMRRSTAALDSVLGAIFLIAGLWSSARSFAGPTNFYDEGILLSGANSILLGAVPHRDFYANYPPGVFLIIAALWKVAPISVLSVRAFALALRFATGILSGLIAGWCTGKRFSWITCGLVVLWLSDLALSPWPWMVGGFAALLFVWLLSTALSNRHSLAWIGSGLAWGALLCIRHDLFVYMSVGVGAMALLWAVRDRASFFEAVNRQRLTLFFAAGSIPILAVWVPVLARAGGRLVFQDLYLDQVRYVLPARALPLPPVMRITTDLWRLPFPAFLVERHQAAVILCLAAPFIAVAMLARGRRFIGSVPAVGLVLVMSLSVLPQLLGRNDQAHTIGSVTPALILLSALGERMAFRSSALTGRLGWMLGTASLLALPMVKDFHVRGPIHARLDWRSRDGGLAWDERVDPGHSEALKFIAQNSSSDEPIFVGTFEHRRAFVNAADLYFLSNRRGATRYMQFDPGLVTRREVQEEMISQMEQRRTRVVVLSQCCPISEEPNASMAEGSDLLDRYLATRYRLVNRIGVYRLLLRNSD